MRILFFILAALSFQPSMAQAQTFSEFVNKIFFGANVSIRTSQLLDALESKPELKHYNNGARQRNLDVTMQMNTQEAFSTSHQFTFQRSPFEGLRVSKGVIELTLGESKTDRKVLDLSWQAEFQNKADATAFFNHLRSQFAKFSLRKKERFEKEAGLMAEYSAADHADGTNSITLFLGQAPETKRWIVDLMFGNSLQE